MVEFRRKMTKSKYNRQTVSKSAYALPDVTTSIAESVCRIMEDTSPKPMLGLQPAKKVLNAADQFNRDHQLPYEEMATSHDKTDDVHTHNSGYPKMRDELQRRRSTAKVIMAAERQRRVQRVTKRKKKNLKGLKRRPLLNDTRRDTRRRGRLQLNRRQQIIQPRFVKMTSKSTSACHKMMTADRGTLTCQVLLKCDENKSNPSSTAVPASTDRDTNGSVSISSYNSFGSIDHEPMVSE